MILLDTHVVAWLTINPKRLSQAAVRAIREASASDGGLIGATALAQGMSLVTADGKIRSSPDVQTIW